MFSINKPIKFRHHLGYLLMQLYSLVHQGRPSVDERREPERSSMRLKRWRPQMTHVPQGSASRRLPAPAKQPIPARDPERLPAGRSRLANGSIPFGWSGKKSSFSHRNFAAFPPTRKIRDLCPTGLPAHPT